MRVGQGLKLCLPNGGAHPPLRPRRAHHRVVDISNPLGLSFQPSANRLSRLGPLGNVLLQSDEISVVEIIESAFDRIDLRQFRIPEIRQRLGR